MKLKKAVLAAALALTVAAAPMPPVMAAADCDTREIPMESISGTVSPQSYVIEWVYKVENGKRYKRLYNTTTRTWVGEWIYVGKA